ncbi:uncharacterized protein LACBIDRAFT_325712 [Laccaria bicolor S238N-H82]|uniref:Predicted protein n=1 Tax=Laccaria bicolor (strain S238N-H82 / ATCC MYA-4686) TaxID=486041 RepID=B0D5Y7_LACBS|nr:uncharacterized protein LACBIDRAFT_325712 [Laccaria bicolor S238N-H82]EDR09850.1 predicted protein [Laccaria bicolor S238N-H82]|eukprot:XP_001879235.1 predicted protein [Laccaria bicolor S238N-H82]
MADDPEAPAHSTTSNLHNGTRAKTDGHGIGRIYFYAVLFFIWAFGVISVGVGAHAWVKSHQEKRAVKAAVVAPTVVSINTHDVDTAGIVVTVACGITAAFSAISALLLFLKHTRFFLAQSIGLCLCAIWIFAGLVAFDFYFHTRSARVTATVGGIAVPQAIINSVEKQLGVTGVYNQLEYLRLVAIIPWFTLLFTIIGSIIFAVSAGKTDTRAPSKSPAPLSYTVDDDGEKEKELSPIEP